MRPNDDVTGDPVTDHIIGKARAFAEAARSVPEVWARREELRTNGRIYAYVEVDTWDDDGEDTVHTEVRYFEDYDEALDWTSSFYRRASWAKFIIQDLEEEEHWSYRNAKVY